MAKRLTAGAFLPLLTYGQISNYLLCEGGTTVTVNTTTTYTAPTSWSTSTITENSTSVVTSSIDGGYETTITNPVTTTETAPAVTIPCPASTVSNSEVSPFSTTYSYASDIAERDFGSMIVPALRKRQFSNSTIPFLPLETVMVYTCLANNFANASRALNSSFVSGPSGYSSNPGGAITVTLSEDAKIAYTTQTLSNGDLQIIEDEVIRSSLADGSVSTTSIPVATRIIPASTTQYTTTKPNGVVEVITEALRPNIISDGATQTSTVPIGTSYSYPSGASIELTTITLANGVIEYIERDISWDVADPDGSTSTTTVFETTSFSYPSSTSTVRYTSTLSNGIVEYVEDDILWSIGTDGQSSSTTIYAHTDYSYPSSTSTVKHTSTLSGGIVEYVEDDILWSIGTDGQSSSTTIYAHTDYSYPSSQATTEVTSTLNNGVVEIIDERLLYAVGTDGLTTKSTQPLTTRFIYPTKTTTSILTSTLTNDGGIVEYVEDVIQLVVDQNNSTSSSILLDSTSFSYPHGSETTVQTTTYTNSIVEYETDELDWSVGPGGTTQTVTRPIGTSYSYPTGVVTVEYTTTAAAGGHDVEIVTDAIYWSLDPSGNSVSYSTTPIGTSFLPETTVQTTTYTNSIVKVETDELDWSVDPDGSTQTVTRPIGTSYSYPTGVVPVEYTTTVAADGNDVEIVTDAVYWSLDSDGNSVSYSTTPIGTSFLPETSETTTTFTNIGVEVVTERLQPIRELDGGLSTSTTGIGTSFSPYPFTGQPTTSTLYYTTVAAIAPGFSTTVSVDFGTVIIPDPVGSTYTSIQQTTFTDDPNSGRSGYLAERIYETTSEDSPDSIPFLTTQVMGSFVYPTAGPVASSDWTYLSTTVQSTTRTDGQVEYTGELVYAYIDVNVLMTTTEDVWELTLAPPVGSTTFTGTWTTDTAGATPTGEYLAQALPGDVLGTFIPATCAPSTSTSTISTTSTPFASTSTTITSTVTSTSFVTTYEGPSTIFDTTLTATLTPHYSTLSSASYNGRYTATVQDTSSYYPVFETYYNLDFPYNDPFSSCLCNETSTETDSYCYAGNGVDGSDLTCAASFESCAAMCVTINNEPDYFPLPCAGVVYEPVSTKCWYKNLVPPNAPNDKCGIWQSYETISGILLNGTDVTDFPTTANTDDSIGQTVYADPTYEDVTPPDNEQPT